MTKVFIGGSRRLSRLNSDIRARLDRIVEKSLPVVVGDANGADKAVQSYLKDRHYPLVEVFCSDQSPRNNLGGWPLRVIRPRSDVRDFDYYATKDRQMAREAAVGLMLWDGQSRGTLLNVLRLIAQDKPTVVYVGPKGRRPKSASAPLIAAILRSRAGSTSPTTRGTPSRSRRIDASATAAKIAISSSRPCRIRSASRPRIISVGSDPG